MKTPSKSFLDSARRQRTFIAIWDRHPEFGWATEVQQILSESGQDRFSISRFAGWEDTSAKQVLREADLVVFTVASSDPIRGASAFQMLRRHGISSPILAVGEDAELQLTELFDAGVSDLLPFPLRRAEVVARLARWSKKPSEFNSAVEELAGECGLAQIVGDSAAIRSQIERIPHYARCEAAVLITGETGTGKEVFARAIHYTGPRSGHAFLPLNCAALPVELVENELFGHEPGAFTGARGAHSGLISEAEGGTVFLDEIDSLPLSVQPKLLRFLQDREYRPLGGTRNRQANVRVISASNADLGAAVLSGKFRQDLFFRLNVLTVQLPPLRRRREDIPALANYLLQRHRLALGRDTAGLSADAMSKLVAYDWPGNVRELENVIERALVLSAGTVLSESDIDIAADERVQVNTSFKAQKAQVVNEFERRYLQETVARCGGNITLAAKAAEKNRRAFFELLRKHHVVAGRRPGAADFARGG